MQATNEQFTNIIDGRKQFIIPVFQRDFSWTQEQCEQLLSDVKLASSREHDSGHFMGSIVYIGANLTGPFQSWLLIDGQQRLTTLTVLMIALRDHLRHTSWDGNNDELTTEKINSYYLKNELETGDRHYKLVLRRKDNATLQDLIENRSPSETDGEYSELLMEAYDYFRSELSEPHCNLEDVYRGITRLKVVDVTLDRRLDNPQLVFESMNSTGVSLRQSDLVRNYLLIGMSEAEQTRLYEDYWRKIETLFRNSEGVFDSFLSDYLALKQMLTQQIRSDLIYNEFKSFHRNDNEVATEELLRDMVRVARNYALFRGIPPIRQSWLADSMNHMRSLNTTQGVLIMTLFDYYESELLTQNEFVLSIQLVESYLLRRAVLNLQTRGYWSVFARIAHSLNRESVFDSLQVSLARLTWNNRFPSDEEFSRGLREHDIYGLRVCKHLLDRLENASHQEPSPVHEYSIEHIMPQNIGEVPEWQSMLGESWEEDHVAWLHRLGNLTLTAYNSKYSNRPFEEKKVIEGGFRHSAVRLNQDVRDSALWTAQEIRERGDRLAARSIHVWPHHEANEDLIQEADIDELRTRAAQRNADDLEMNEGIRRVLDAIRTVIGEMVDVIEVIERKSVCCYGPDFFAELIPMRRSVRVLLPLEFSEIEIPDGLTVIDASTWRCVSYRSHTNADLIVEVYDETTIVLATPVIRQALELSQ